MACREQRMRVLVVDPFLLWRQAIERVLRSNGVEVVSGVGSLRVATVRIKELRPDLVVVEPEEQDDEFGVWLREQRERRESMKVIVFSSRDDPEVIGSALANGAVAYVVKRAEPVEVAAVLRQLECRSIYFGSDAPLATVERGGGQADLDRRGLTRREQELLCLVAEGGSNKEMARSLWVTEQTIKFHLSNIYRKLGVTNRTQASRWAHDHGVTSGRLTVVSSRP